MFELDGYVFIKKLPDQVIYKQNETKEMNLKGLELCKVLSWNPTVITTVSKKNIIVVDFDVSKIGAKRVLLHVENTVLPIEIIVTSE